MSVKKRRRKESNIDSNECVLLSIGKLSKLESPSKELTKICGVVNHRNFSKKIFTQHPNLRLSAYKLINLLTIYWPDPKVPNQGRLIDRCLGEALDNCEAIFFRDDSKAAIDLEITFIKSIYDVLGDVFKTKLMVNSNFSWKLHELSDLPLTDVLSKQEVDGLTWTVSGVEDIPYGKKIVIASRVFSMRELTVAGLVE